MTDGLRNCILIPVGFTYLIGCCERFDREELPDGSFPVGFIVHFATGRQVRYEGTARAGRRVRIVWLALRKEGSGKRKRKRSRKRKPAKLRVALGAAGA